MGFMEDSSLLPGSKIDSRTASIPPAADEWAADDTNKIRQALLDVRAGLLAETEARAVADQAIIASGVQPGGDVGSALVTATGRDTPRAVADRFAQLYYALADYGATGTGEDLAGFFASAFADIAADGGGGTIVIPRGSFTLSTTITIPPGVTVVGYGQGKVTPVGSGTYIYVTTAITAFKMSSYSSLRGIWLHGDSTSVVPGSIGIEAVSGSTHWTIHDVRVAYFEHAISLFNCWVCQIHDSHFTYASGSGARVAWADHLPGGSEGTNIVSWYGCEFQNNTTGVSIWGGSLHSFVSCTIEGNVNGVHFTKDATTGGAPTLTSFTDCYFEVNTGAPVLGDVAAVPRLVSFSKCFFTGLKKTSGSPIFTNDYAIHFNAGAELLVEGCAFANGYAVSAMRFESACTRIRILPCYYSIISAPPAGADRYFDPVLDYAGTGGISVVAGTYAGEGVSGQIDLVMGDALRLSQSGGGAGPAVTGTSASPEGVVTAPTGSLHLRVGGGGRPVFYTKETGTGNTGWRPNVGYVRGQAAFASSTTKVVTLPFTEADANYMVVATPDSQETIWVENKTTTSFTLRTSQAASTATVDYFLWR